MISYAAFVVYFFQCGKVGCFCLFETLNISRRGRIRAFVRSESLVDVFEFIVVFESNGFQSVDFFTRFVLFYFEFSQSLFAIGFVGNGSGTHGTFRAVFERVEPFVIFFLCENSVEFVGFLFYRVFALGRIYD